MDEMRTQGQALADEIASAYQRLNIDQQTKKLAELTATSQSAGFWDDNLAAQQTMRDIAKLEAQINPWKLISNDITDVNEMAKDDADPAMLSELQTELIRIQTEYDALKEQLKFNGPFDDHYAIVSLHAGAGGTDAQDWSQMLLRMYVRYAERSGWKTVMIDESPGEEAGLKSATFEVSGPFAYGKLKGEHGVHRLVRLSPFNAESRETSFAKVEVVPKIDKPDDVPIDDKDLRIDVYRSGGHGGQSVNTTDSAVRVTHQPTGIVVAIQNERSQLQNKETAMTILRSKLAQLQLEQHLENLAELKGPNQSAEWGNQIRSYVLHPYKQVKDLRSRYETSDPDAVLDGNLEPFVQAYLEFTLGE